MAEIKLNLLQPDIQNDTANKICEFTDVTVNAVSLANGQSSITPVFEHSSYSGPYPHDSTTFSLHSNNYDQYYYTPENFGMDFRSGDSEVVRSSHETIPFHSEISHNNYPLLRSTRFYPQYIENGINLRTDSASFMAINAAPIHEQKKTIFDEIPNNSLFNQTKSVTSEFNQSSQAGLHINTPTSKCNVDSKFNEIIGFDRSHNQTNMFNADASNSSCDNIPRYSYSSQIKEENTDILDLDSHKVVYPLSLPTVEAKQILQCGIRNRFKNTSPTEQAAPVAWNANEEIIVLSKKEPISNLIKKELKDSTPEEPHSFPRLFPTEERIYDNANKSKELNNQAISNSVEFKSTKASLGTKFQGYESSRSSLQEISSSVKSGAWKSNEARRPKTYNCTACNKWFTSSGHLKRHYNTTLHKNAVKSSGQPDPASLPISTHHHPNKGLYTGNANEDQNYQKFKIFHDNHPNGLAGSSARTPDPRSLLKTPSQISSVMEQWEEECFFKNQHQHLENREPVLQYHHRELDLHQRSLSQNQIKNVRSMSDQSSENPANIHMICKQYQEPVHQHNFQLTTQQDILFNIPPTNIHNIVKQQHQYIVSPLAINTSTISTQVTVNKTNIPIQPLSPQLKTPTNLYQTNFRTSGRNQIQKKPNSYKVGPFGVTDAYLSSEQKKKTCQTNYQSTCTSMYCNKRFEQFSAALPYNEHFLEILNRTNSDLLNENIIKKKTPISLVFLEAENKFIPRCQQSPQEADVPSQNFKLSAKLPEPTTVRQLNHYSTVPTSSVDSNMHEKNETNKVIKKTKAKDNCNIALKTNSLDIIKCEECNKVFTKICYLTQHNKSFHSGEQPYRCQQCGKRFQSEEIYVAHLNKHKSHDKPFKCDLCPKQFHHKTDLRRHIEAIHTGNKAHACNQCNKRFCRKDHLRKHCDTHTKNKVLKKITEIHSNVKVAQHEMKVIESDKISVIEEIPLKSSDEIAFIM